MSDTAVVKPPAEQIDLKIEPRRKPKPSGPLPEERPRRADASTATGTDFSVALIEANRMPSGSRAWRVLASVLLHSIALGVPLLLSLWFTDTIDLREYVQTLLAAPPPPPPPPPPVATAALKPKAVQRVFSTGGKLLAPTTIPREVAALHEEPLPPEAALGGVTGGVPGGVPGGQLGGVLGGIIGGMPSTAKLNVPPPPDSARKIVRVGGRIRPPRPIVQTDPVYPTLARQARIQGNVVLDTILDTEGRIVEVTVVSGHPLLIQAALDCVRHWKFEPTYLNDEPVAVKMIVTVSFQMR